MNTRDLIVGHFEGTLSQTDQGRLDQLLVSSPDARADFERHQMIEEGLAEDSRSLVPPIGLREATLAAAIGGAVSTIGGGLAAWFTTKVAFVVGTVAVGGLVVGGVLMNGGEDPKGASDNQTPVVQVEELDNTAPSSVDSRDDLVLEEDRPVEAKAPTTVSAAEVRTGPGAQPTVVSRTDAEGGTKSERTAAKDEDRKGDEIPNLGADGESSRMEKEKPIWGSKDE